MPLPDISSVKPANSARSGGTTLTILGKSFWPADSSPTMSTGATLNRGCATSSWVSYSSVACQMRGDPDGASDVALTVHGSTGVRQKAFMLDGAEHVFFFVC